MKKYVWFFLLAVLSKPALAQKVDYTQADRDKLGNVDARLGRLEQDVSTLKEDVVTLKKETIETNTRLVRIETRQEDTDKQLNYIGNLILVLIAGIFSFMGFIIWDRRSTLKPLEERVEKLEKYAQAHP
jgi:uncharacterized protein YlxW (UPF0749 family)